MGATHVIDRQQRFPAISAEISEITGGLPITFVFDAISVPDTQQVAYDLLPPSDGQLAGVTRQTGSIEVKTPGKTVNLVHVHALKEFSENSEELSLLYGKLNSLLNEGAIKACFSAICVAGGTLADMCRVRSLFGMKCCPTVWQVFRKDWNVWTRALFLA